MCPACCLLSTEVTDVPSWMTPCDDRAAAVRVSQSQAGRSDAPMRGRPTSAAMRSANPRETVSPSLGYWCVSSSCSIQGRKGRLYVDGDVSDVSLRSCRAVTGS